MALVRRDDLRGSDDAYTALPAHLRFRPFPVPNLFGGIKPRYLDVLKKPLVKKFDCSPEKFPANAQLQSVEPRYLTPRGQSPQRPSTAVEKYTDSREYQFHKEFQTK